MTFGFRTNQTCRFRDLLLETALAKAKRAVVDRRYGDIASMLLRLIEDDLLVNDPESTEESSAVNRMVVRPFTKYQSDVEGMLRLEENLMILSKSNIDDIIGSDVSNRMEFQVSDFRLSSIDTLHNPI